MGTAVSRLRVLKFDGAVAPRVLKFDSGFAAEGVVGAFMDTPCGREGSKGAKGSEGSKGEGGRLRRKFL